MCGNLHPCVLQYYEADHLRLPRQPQDLPSLTGDLTSGSGSPSYRQQNPRSSSPSEASLTFLPFPGNEKARPTRQTSPGGKPVGVTMVTTDKVQNQHHLSCQEGGGRREELNCILMPVVELLVLLPRLRFFLFSSQSDLVNMQDISRVRPVLLVSGKDKALNCPGLIFRII